MDTKKPTTVIIGVNYWGKGDDLAEAKKNFRRAGGTLSKGYMILTFDAESTFEGVDGMGRYTWLGNAPETTIVLGTHVKSVKKEG